MRLIWKSLSITKDELILDAKSWYIDNYLTWNQESIKKLFTLLIIYSVLGKNIRKANMLCFIV